jgi:hypothetical protein
MLTGITSSVRWGECVASSPMQVNSGGICQLRAAFAYVLYLISRLFKPDPNKISNNDFLLYVIIFSSRVYR